LISARIVLARAVIYRTKKEHLLTQDGLQRPVVLDLLP
jgi:hypothetical protein